MNLHGVIKSVAWGPVWAILFCSAAGLSVQVMAVDSEGAALEKKLEAGEIVLTELEEDGSSGAETVSILDAPVDAVWRVITDFSRQPEYMPDIAEARRLGKAGTGENALVRGVMKILMFKFTYFLEYTFEERKNGVRILRWVKADPPEGEKASFDYRMHRGTWILEPVDDGRKTRSTYRHFIDPGDAMPDLLKSKLTGILARRSAPAVIVKLRKLLESEGGRKKR